MSLYRRFLVQAWKNTWANKYLWFFGLFAVLIGSTGELDLLFQNFNDVATKGLFPGIREYWATGFFSAQGLTNFGNLMLADSFSLLIVLTILAIGFLLSCFLLWFSVVSQGALVFNYSRLLANKSHSYNNGLEQGMKKFWPVLGLNVIQKAIVYLAFLILALPIVFWLYRPSIGQSLFFIIAYLVFIPISIIASFVVKYAIGYVVIKGEKIVDSFRKGWELFLANWLISVEMAFILFGISFFATLVVIIFLAMLAIPIIFLIALFSQLLGSFSAWIIILGAITLATLTVVLAGSILATFQISAWTGLFIELINKGGVSKIVRIFERK